MATSELFDLLKAAQRIALEKHGVPNILQPGIIKELMMAEILGQDLVPTKDAADAMDKDGNFYEYLASIRRVDVPTNKGCSFQMDRVTRNNLKRITRNKAFYFGIFKDHLEVEEIWRVEIPLVIAEVKRQLENCKNDIAHVNFLLRWLEKSGTKVFPLARMAK